MEDQGKRLMLAVAVAFGIMMVWTTLFPPEKPKKDESKKTDESGEVAKGSEDSASTPDANKPATEAEAAKAAAVAARGEEVFYDFEFEDIRVRFSSYDASLHSWELLAERLADRSGKEHKPENLIRVQEDDHRFLRVWFEDSTFDVPAGAEWRGEKVNDRELKFTWRSNDIEVVKEITIHPESYLLMMKVSLNLVGAPKAKQSLALSMFSQQDTDTESGGMFNRVDRMWKAACYYQEEIHTKTSKSLEKKGIKRRTNQIDWGGFDHAYFLTVASIIEGTELDRIDCDSYPLKGVAGGMGVNLVQASINLKSGESLRSTYAIYLGPKYGDDLRAANTIAGGDTKLEESVDLGFLGMIAGPLLWLLNFFQSFVVNWGIAIVLLTIVVKTVTLPWTHKSMKSMKAMAKLKPHLEKIKEKYKDDRAKQNVETMALFKSHKVSPMSGCLPMILQMPIWFALYRGLTVAGELYQAPFIPGWIDDLTVADPFYIMPILLTGMMFLQTRMTPSTQSGAQQKIMMYGMPIMFGGFSLFFPSGLTLYIFTNTCFTALHHLYMHKTDPNPAVAAGGKSVSKDIIDVKEASDSSPDNVSDSSPDSSSDSSPSGKSEQNRPAKKRKKSGKNKNKNKNKRKR